MCGIFGIVQRDGFAVESCIVALNALQHRGRETAGVATQLGKDTFCHIGLGKVEQVFLPHYKWAEYLPGCVGVGHVRYSTSSQSNLDNAQPIRGVFRGRPFYLVHNGNIVNLRELKLLAKEKEDSDISDTKLVAKIISQSDALTFEAALLEVLPLLRGAFCFIALYENRIYAARDSFGFHPLQLGVRNNKDWLVASESCAFWHLGGELLKDINPGELVIIDRDGFEIKRWTESFRLKFDIFEFIYFLRPDSVVYNTRVELVRRRMGWYLAKEHPLDVDLVISIPASGDSAAFGYWLGLQDLGIKARYDPTVLFRPHAKRTFIGPDEKERWNSIRLKFTTIPENLRQVKNLAVVDDSLVRGKTRKYVSKLLRQGANMVGNSQLNIFGLNSSPPYLYPDFYGIDTYRKKWELIAARLAGDLDAVRKEVDLDYLGYLCLDNTIQAILDIAPPGTFSKDSFYTGPFTGEYPDGTVDLEM